MIYFPNYGRTGQITIEAYDLDAFRDSGLHWQYLKFALDDYAAKMQVFPDPYALEMTVEGVAQFAVLLFRMGGEVTKEAKVERLTMEHINQALIAFQQKLDQHPLTPSNINTSKIASSTTTDRNKEIQEFEEIGEKWGLTFEHRNSNWLSRLIRSYVIKEEENVARMSIPPAFGGGRSGC